MKKKEQVKLKGIVSISSEDYISRDNQNEKESINNNNNKKITVNTSQSKTQSIKKKVIISKHLHHQNQFNFQIIFLNKY